MDINLSTSKGILTSGGWKEIPMGAATTWGTKVTFYYLEEQTAEKVDKAKDAILEVTSKTNIEYCDAIESFSKDLEEQPFLVNEGEKLYLWDEATIEEALSGFQACLKEFKEQNIPGGANIKKAE